MSPLLLAAVLLSASCAAPATAVQPRPKVLTLKAEGSVRTVPDEVSFRLNLSCERKKASEASACLRDDVAELHTLLDELGIAEGDRQTLGVQLHKRYRWTNNSNVFEGYTAATGLAVTLRDVDLLDVVYDQLLDDEQLSLDGLTYGHSQIDSLARVAHLRALDEADALGDVLIARIGAKRKRIVGISNLPVAQAATGRFAESSDAMAMEVVQTASAASYAGPGGFVGAPGTIELRTRLWVEYAVD